MEPPAFDFGEALPDKTLTKEFAIRNFGNQDLVIENVSTSCGCTAARPLSGANSRSAPALSRGCAAVTPATSP